MAAFSSKCGWFLVRMNALFVERDSGLERGIFYFVKIGYFQHHTGPLTVRLPGLFSFCKLMGIQLVLYIGKW